MIEGLLCLNKLTNCLSIFSSSQHSTHARQFVQIMATGKTTIRSQLSVNIETFSISIDGLWDVLDNETVSRITFQTLSKYPNEKHRYTMAAQELVAKSRGRANESGHWRLADCKAPATVDDISVIVIPIYQYYKEFCDWEKNFFDAQERRRKLAAEALIKAEEKENNGNVDEDAEEAEEATNGTGDVEEKLESIKLTDESNGDDLNESNA